MKKITIILFSFLLIGNFALAQIDKGHIRLEITEVGSDDEQMAAMLQMMKGSFTDIYFNEKHSLSTMNLMGGMMDIKTLNNNDSGEVLMLFSAMGNNMYVESTQADREAMSKENMPDIKVTYDKSDTKEIMGYKTHKANIEIKGTSSLTMSAYVAPNIKLSNKIVQGMESVDLDGFPLSYEIDANGIKLTMTTTKLENSVDETIFKLDTTGYTKTTLEDLTKSLGGMGGGLGF